MRSTAAAAALLALCTVAAPLHAQRWRPPADSERCPSRWGADDERGAANHMTPASVVEAARLIRTGEVFELGRLLNRSIPFVGNRRFDLHTLRTAENPGASRRGSNEELLVSEIGQVGTQLDGFAHQAIDGSLYNCHRVDDIATRTGFSRLGIENAGTLFSRGVLLDVAALKGVETLPDHYEVTPDDLRGAARRQGVELRPGDAVLVNTGWGRLWGVDNARYGAAGPGLGTAAAGWLAERDPLLVGIDNAAVNVTPDPDPDLSNPVHQILFTVNGIYLLENLRLDELAAARAYEFALVVQPLKIEGGTGSTVAPTALR